jgi:hypothetical protein
MTIKEDQLKQIEAAILAFEQEKLYESSIDLYYTLGYRSTKTDRITPNNFDGLTDIFNLPKNSIYKERALADQWKQIEFIFQLGTTEMQQQETLFQETLNRNDPASYLFFSIELKGKDYSRNQLSQIARELNKPFPMHVFRQRFQTFLI